MQLTQTQPFHSALLTRHFHLQLQQGPVRLCRKRHRRADTRIFGCKASAIARRLDISAPISGQLQLSSKQRRKEGQRLRQTLRTERGFSLVSRPELSRDKAKDKQDKGKKPRNHRNHGQRSTGKSDVCHPTLHHYSWVQPTKRVSPFSWKPSLPSGPSKLALALPLQLLCSPSAFPTSIFAPLFFPQPTRSSTGHAKNSPNHCKFTPPTLTADILFIHPMILPPLSYL